MYGILAILFAVLIAIFSVQNSAPVNVKFIIWHFDNISLVLVILASAIIGGLFVFFVSLFKAFTLKRQLSTSRKENVTLQQELERLMEISTTKEDCE